MSTHAVLREELSSGPWMASGSNLKLYFLRSMGVTRAQVISSLRHADLACVFSHTQFCRSVGKGPPCSFPAK